MQNKSSNEIKTGIVSILALVILVFSINYVNKRSGNNEYQVKFLFDRSVGIKPSAPIYVNGVERGNVSTIDNYKGQALITGNIDNVNDIMQDAYASILVLELTGGKKIEINPGSSQKNFSGEFIPGKNISDLSELVEKLTLIADDAGILVNRLDTLGNSVNSIISDTNFINDLKSAVSEGNALITNVNELIDNNFNKINIMIADLKSISSTLKASIDDNQPKVSAIINKLDKTLNSADSLFNNANTIAINTDQLISRIDNIVTDIKSNNSAINKFIYDDEFAVKLDSAVVNLSELVKFIEQYGVNVNLRIGTRP